MSRLISIAEASEMLGVTTKTLKIWANEAKIKCYRTVGSHRRFRIEDIENFLGEGIQTTKTNNNEEMVNELISVVTCFSTRLYGERGCKKLKEVIAELETERGGNSEGNNKGSSY